MRPLRRHLHYILFFPLFIDALWAAGVADVVALASTLWEVCVRVGGSIDCMPPGMLRILAGALLFGDAMPSVPVRLAVTMETVDCD